MKHDSIWPTLVAMLALCIVTPSPAAADVIVVDRLQDSVMAGFCDLRSAVEAANTDLPVAGCAAGNGTDDINFGVEGVILLNNNLLQVAESVRINGPGVNSLTIDGGGSYSMFNFAAGQIIEINNMTLFGGVRSDGGCIFNSSNSLTIEDVRFVKCTATSNGGALASTYDTFIRSSSFESNESVNGGGAWFSNGSSEIEDSTFKGNSASNGGGLGLAVVANVQVKRSTFFDNQAKISGGAIDIGSSNASLELISSTLVQNEADSDGDNSGRGGGVSVTAGSFNTTNSIIAANINTVGVSSAPDVGGITPMAVTSGGYNIIGNNEGADSWFASGNPNPSGDYVGTPGTPLVVELLALGLYGGSTQNLPPTDNSIAVDAGNCPGEAADQRGASNWETGLRPFDLEPANAADGCDVGAVEAPAVRDVAFRDGFEN